MSTPGVRRASTTWCTAGSCSSIWPGPWTCCAGCGTRSDRGVLAVEDAEPGGAVLRSGQRWVHLLPADVRRGPGAQRRRPRLRPPVTEVFPRDRDTDASMRGASLENDHEVWAGCGCSAQGGVWLRTGIPSPTGAGARVRRSIWASLSWAPARLTRESFGLAEPSFAVGFGDAGGEVVADLGDAVPLGGSGQCMEHLRPH